MTRKLLLSVVFAIVGFGGSQGSAQALNAEAEQVAAEACGDQPDLKCLSELRKLCHAQISFRCYYSRKGRLDAIRNVGFPDDRNRPFDE